MNFTAIWMFLLPLLAILLPVWLGYRFGLRVKKRPIEIPEAPVSATVSATLGLMAFMLAFTFQFVGTRFDKRKELMLEEISDIRTTYLHAGLVPEPFRTKARNHIASYVSLRIELSNDRSKLQMVKQQSQVLLDSLWSYSETLAEQDRSSEAYSLFIGSVGSMVSLFNERIALIFHSRMPSTVLYILGFVSFISMLILGYQFGISGSLNHELVFLMAIIFAAVMWLIFALDRPEVGLIPQDQAPLLNLQKQING